jgi:hypothetical protein
MVKRFFVLVVVLILWVLLMILTMTHAIVLNVDRLWIGVKNMTPDEQILICAVRYTLGRRSYMVGFVCDYVKAKVRTLSHNCVKCIIRDIEEELERCHATGHTLGDHCDERDWNLLLKVLKEV